jgi:hypothetical protein
VIDLKPILRDMGNGVPAAVVVAALERALGIATPCDYCKAEPGSSCVTTSGAPRKWPHTERYIAAGIYSKPPRVGRRA